MWKKYLQRIFLVIIAVLGVKTGVESFMSSMNERNNDTVVVANWNRRVSKLIAPIPFERGVIGYISSEDILGDTFITEDSEEEYVLMQYTVAPLILVRGTDQEWSILNLIPEAYKKWSEVNANDFEVVGLRGDIYLVHKVRK